MELQAGTATALFNNQKLNPLFNKPVFQLTTLGNFTYGDENKSRFKANLSDGVFYVKSIFSSELEEMFKNGKIKIYSLIRLEVFSIRPKENSTYVYIQSISDYQDCSNVIGNPVNIMNGKQSLDASLNRTPENNNPRKDASVQRNSNRDVNPKPELSYSKTNARASEPVKRNKPNDDDRLTDIKRIFPQKKLLAFKGRVVSKSEIKKFNTQKGEGKLFSFEVADKTGQIKCVAFSEAVDIFFPLIETGQVYEISNITVKPSNKKFSNSTSDFEIQLETSSDIRKVDDDGIPKYSFNFVKLSDLATVGGIVDCLAVIREVYPPAQIVVKSTGKETSKRDLVIIDESGNCRLTIWGQKSEEEYEKDSVICIKSAKVGDYNGVNLSTIGSTTLISNIDLPESVELLTWYQDEGRNITIEKPKKTSKRSLINDVKENSLEYATVQASIVHLKTEGLYYDSCPSENCNKKVSAEDNGMYRCEKCNYTFEKCNQRYMLNLHVGDFTGQMWVTLFNDHAKTLLGMSASALKDMNDENPENVHNLVKSVTSQEYQFRIKNKEENYNGESKTRSNCLELEKIKYPSETKKMLDAIEKIHV